MAVAYEPNIEGALQVLVDLMTGHGFTMTRAPYAPNYRGLVDALIDLKDGFPTFVPFRVGFDATEVLLPVPPAEGRGNLTIPRIPSSTHF